MLYSYAVVVVQIFLAIVAGIVVFRRARIRWGGIRAGILTILVGLPVGGILLLSFMDTDQKLSDYKVGFETVHAMSKMYELDSIYDRASTSGQEQLRSDLLTACHAVQRLGCGDITRTIEWGRYNEVFDAHTVAYVHIAELDPAPVKRAEAFGQLLSDMFCSPDELHDWQRVARMIEKDPNRSIGPGDQVIQRLDHHCDRIIPYCISGWYVHKRHYDIALAHLEHALGKEWVRSGNVDQWWQQHLPPRLQDHLFFGYVWYKTGNTQNALREFRKAKGKDAGIKDMDQFYKSDAWL